MFQKKTINGKCFHGNGKSFRIMFQKKTINRKSFHSDRKNFHGNRKSFHNDFLSKTINGKTFRSNRSCLPEFLPKDSFPSGQVIRTGWRGLLPGRVYCAS